MFSGTHLDKRHMNGAFVSSFFSLNSFLNFSIGFKAYIFQLVSCAYEIFIKL